MNVDEMSVDQTSAHVLLLQIAAPINTIEVLLVLPTDLSRRRNIITLRGMKLEHVLAQVGKLAVAALLLFCDPCLIRVWDGACVFLHASTIKESKSERG